MMPLVSNDSNDDNSDRMENLQALQEILVKIARFEVNSFC